MQLCQNQKIFSQFFSAFPECIYNLEYFEKKYVPQRFFLSEFNDSKKRSYLNAEKVLYLNTYGQSTC